MSIDNFFDSYGRLVDQWTGRAPQKTLADYSDAEIAQEYHRRALKQHDDQGVQVRLTGILLKSKVNSA